jgi:hypothetical protein
MHGVVLDPGAGVGKPLDFKGSECAAISNLEEHRYGSVAIDRYSSRTCGGIYLDRGELEILVKAKFSLLGRIFGK